MATIETSDRRREQVRDGKEYERVRVLEDGVDITREVWEEAAQKETTPLPYLDTETGRRVFRNENGWATLLPYWVLCVAVEDSERLVAELEKVINQK